MNGNPISKLFSIRNERQVVDPGESIVGADLVLTETPDGAITLHVIDGDGVSPVGTFTDVTDAWRALDEVDAPRDMALAA
jgi:hypothetical protein